MRFDALVAASGKCLEGVPGMGFVFLRKAILDACAGNSQSLAMDLFDQYQYMEKTTQWRFTPPTHVMVALAEAVAQFVEEGGQPARLARYQDNCRTLIDGLTALGLKPFLKPELQAPIIVTWHAPAHPAYDFKRFYAAAKQRGFILYPGKLTEVETFRVGCIGAIGRNEMQQAVNAVAETLRELGVRSSRQQRRQRHHLDRDPTADSAALPGYTTYSASSCRSCSAMCIDGVIRRRIHALDLDADAPAALEQQQIEFGAVVRGPEVGLVRLRDAQRPARPPCLPSWRRCADASSARRSRRCPAARAAARCRGSTAWVP